MFRGQGPIAMMMYTWTWASSHDDVHTVCEFQWTGANSHDDVHTLCDVQWTGADSYDGVHMVCDVQWTGASSHDDVHMVCDVQWTSANSHDDVHMVCVMFSGHGPIAMMMVMYTWRMMFSGNGSKDSSWLENWQMCKCFDLHR